MDIHGLSTRIRRTAAKPEAHPFAIAADDFARALVLAFGAAFPAAVSNPSSRADNFSFSSRAATAIARTVSNSSRVTRSILVSNRSNCCWTSASTSRLTLPWRPAHRRQASPRLRTSCYWTACCGPPALNMGRRGAGRNIAGDGVHRHGFAATPGGARRRPKRQRETIRRP